VRRFEARRPRLGCTPTRLNLGCAGRVQLSGKHLLFSVQFIPKAKI
jgi:hypothetical protein